ncbi:MAG TPA: AAA family ATPase [Bryobacteraceae bacterium]|jgi:predicted ATPase
MHLHYLSISKWKNLDGFKIEFRKETFTSVLVGRNGTGKSNVLEAIIIIFRDLDLGAQTPFAYTIQYECGGKEVTVDSDPERAGSDTIRISVDGKTTGRKEFSRQGGGTHLPKHLFVYYSGVSDRMMSHFEQHERQFDLDLREGKDQPLRPLLYVREVHSKFALMSFFWKGDEKEREFLERYLRIVDLDSVLFVLKRPYWFSASRRTKDDDDGRFWGALGVVRNLVERLFDLAFAPMRVTERGSKGQSHDRMYLYLKSKKDMHAFAKPYKTPKDFFKALDSLHVADLVEDCRARVKVKNVDGSLTFRELSEGEQQLLMVLGLLRFTREDEALILLDEPDTHLNPNWSLEYVDLLRRAVPDEKTQIVMATHDPLLVAGLVKRQVHVMRRDADGKVTESHPERDPQGMGVAALLMSDVYGLRSELDAVTLRRLDTRRRLAIKKKLNQNEKGKLARLNEWVDEQDFTTADRDPLYTRFVQAMTAAEQKEGLQKSELTPDEMKKQKKLAADILAKLRAKEGKKK